MFYKRLFSRYSPCFLNLLLALGILVGLLGSLPVASTQAASTYFVKPDGDGNCSTWEAACNLQEALVEAGPGSEIWAASGVYTPTTTETDPRLATFQLKAGVALYGGFVGGESTLEGRDFATNVTILSGDIDNNDIINADGVVTDTDGIVGENTYHVVTGSGLTETAILDGFIVTAGKANGLDSYSFGGGIYNNNSGPTLMNITLSGNWAAAGGGIYNRDGSSPTLMNITFSDNLAAVGGGMYNRDGSSPTLMNVTFSRNLVAAVGGGIYNENSSPTLMNVTFRENTSYGDGGGMFNADSSLTLTNVIFSSNFANDRGGGTYNENSSPILTNVTFSNNSATYGGGIYNHDSYPMLDNSILWGNTAIEAGTSQIDHDGNNPGSTLRYSLIQYGCPDGNTCRVPIIVSDPLFVDAANHNLHLQSISPAIDAGDNTAPGLVDITTDRDGTFRFLDVPTVFDSGNGTAPIIDLGAYEHDGQAPSTTQLEALPNPSQLGQFITFVATVSTPVGAQSPNGNVTFYSDENLLGSSPLNETGMATYISADLPLGSHTITSHYTGSADFVPSTSDPLTQIVKRSSLTGLDIIPNSVQYGQVVNMTASVSTADSLPGGPPTGSVEFYDGETLLETGNLNRGLISFTTSALAIGMHTIRAEYTGDVDFLASTSAPIELMVDLPKLYLPVIFHAYQACFAGPLEDEPNNSSEQANGPLCFGQEYTAYSNDPDDYFFFYLPEPATLTIDMDDHKGEGVQMLLYYPSVAANNLKFQSYQDPYLIEYDGFAGWYYLRIYASGGYSNSDTYTLQVNVSLHGDE